MITRDWNSAQRHLQRICTGILFFMPLGLVGAERASRPVKEDMPVYLIIFSLPSHGGELAHLLMRDFDFVAKINISRSVKNITLL